jgi:hypothetical protein
MLDAPKRSKRGFASMLSERRREITPRRPLSYSAMWFAAARL